MTSQAHDVSKMIRDDFDGFPMHIPEDCVEYSLYIIDSKLNSQKELIHRLEAVRREALNITNSLLKNYIWHRDAFKLDLKLDAQAFLHGTSSFGDSIEDEWLIVYILRELTSIFPNLWVKVVDSGGEFLLIQAANTLPRWLTPEVADNRVWIHQSLLKIIPFTSFHSSSSAPSHNKPKDQAITLPNALSILSTSPTTLFNSPLIESEAFYPLSKYPSHISDSLHHALLLVPSKLAYILHERPAAIALAIEAFYLRDPVALKPLRSETQVWTFQPNDLVVVSTRFTKVLYAQVVSQHFETPPAWQPLISKPQSDQKVQARMDIGMKVTSGFEMLLGDRQYENSPVVREIKILLDDLASDPALLPSMKEIEVWKDSKREDNDNWLNIDFEAFQKELDGKTSKPAQETVPRTIGPESSTGFGEERVQQDLRKMVQRFEDFLNDDDAGLEGAEFGEADEEVENSGDSEDSEEDREVSFDQEEFTRMMREMMGMGSENHDAGAMDNHPTIDQASSGGKIDDPTSDEDEGHEGQKIRDVMRRMETELSARGALDLDPMPGKSKLLKDNDYDDAKSKGKGKGKMPATEAVNMEGDGFEDSTKADVDIDFNLAKNMLESFRSQAGMPGPGGTLINLMGVTLPRDEDEVNDVREGDDK